MGKVNIPRDSQQQDFLTGDDYLSHVTWPAIDFLLFYSQDEPSRAAIQWELRGALQTLDLEEVKGLWLTTA